VQVEVGGRGRSWSAHLALSMDQRLVEINNKASFPRVTQARGGQEGHSTRGWRHKWRSVEEGGKAQSWLGPQREARARANGRGLSTSSQLET